MSEKTPFVPPELGPLNLRPPKAWAMSADDHWQANPGTRRRATIPRCRRCTPIPTPCLTIPATRSSSIPATTAPNWTLEIYRDGHQPRDRSQVEAIAGVHTPTPPDAYRNGCGWPVTHRWRLPADLRSGFYRVVSTCARANGGKFVQHHFFVVRPTDATRQAKILMILPTGTWTAYNDFGGANHYFGVDGPERNLPRRCCPWSGHGPAASSGCRRARRASAPIPLPEFGDAPRYPMKEWAFANGFGQYYAAAGWAQYDRHFVVWAEKEGYALDIITQTDLHYRPELLDAYPCVTIVGHDEYWTREMRLAIEAYVERGGQLARFGANFLWQIRLEDEGKRQVCYKFKAINNDPIAGTDRTICCPRRGKTATSAGLAPRPSA